MKGTAASFGEKNGGFTIERAGMLTALQHLGTTGSRALGIPTGGAMDRYALRVANWLVGNAQEATGLELTLARPELTAQSDMLIAVCGAYMGPTVDGEELPMWRPVFVRRGAVIRFGRAESGCRAYVAAAGGLAGKPGARLAAGAAVHAAQPAGRWAAAWLAALALEGAGRRRSAMAAAPWFAPPLAYGGAGDDGIELRAMPGSEYGQFSEAARDGFFRERYRVAPASNRMGIRLSGFPIERESGAELLSHGVTAGAVQVPAGGEPIVLGADCQTTGGYPKIAHVASVDMPLLAQAKPGDTIRFQYITVEEAQRLMLAFEIEMALLSAAIRCRTP
ncbi:biotin-dependent carboxyltransferase family protein [Paenibacillus sp. NPDC058071]|uniref:5-oxoprolinase subunit C family protein n=1 Tax=Paenibacillus sp. NPDC058071 TaxID=3346326 RepID=UPI0036D9329E